MNNKGMPTIKRGQAITFRLPSDTPDHILKQLEKLKVSERRNFSSKIAEFVLKGVSDSMLSEREAVTIPLPKQLNKEQRNWLRHSHSEALLGNIIYQLLENPIRATSILASLNSNALDIDEALYLQEVENASDFAIEEPDEPTIVPEANVSKNIEDDLMNFDWDTVRQEQASTSEEELEEDDDLLGDFLASMNK